MNNRENGKFFWFNGNICLFVKICLKKKKLWFFLGESNYPTVSASKSEW